MNFHVIPRGTGIPSSGTRSVYLKQDFWNDYSYVTMFFLSLHDENGKYHKIGNIKIGFRGQTESVATYSKLEKQFRALGDEFFSVGQSVDFYKNLASLPNESGKRILKRLRDIVIRPTIIDEVRKEGVFGTSLLRNFSLSIIRGQFARVLDGKPELTNFKFKFVRPRTAEFDKIELGFDVKVGATPSTNIHALIGRNGVGKTTLLNGMIEAIADKSSAIAKFVDTIDEQGNSIVDIFSIDEDPPIADDYFSRLVSVSFSAFDKFTPPPEQSDPAQGTCYFYIGLKDQKKVDTHRTIENLQDDCGRALIGCFLEPKKAERWLNAIDKLGSDDNFASMKLEQLKDIYSELRLSHNPHEQSDSNKFRNRYQKEITPLLSVMSSGHAIVLLTITRLVETVEEKTLVLIDEPESHLHPPLLSAFIRALSDLLIDRNGLAIIATHSPVVLQEIPRSCAWKVYRVGTNVTYSRPAIETFGENVGVLTSEVFSLEVVRSGFHALLRNSVNSGRSFEEIMADYDDQLGFEGKAILMSLIADRDRSK